MAHVERAGGRRNTPPLYVAIPYKLLSRPPAAHRGINSAASNRIAAFESHVLTGVLVKAWIEVEGPRQVQQSRKAGARDIAQQLEFEQRHTQEWREEKRRRRRGHYKEAPELLQTFTRSEEGGYGHTHKPELKRGQRIKRAGQFAYQNERKRLRRNPSAVIPVDCSPHALLRAGGLAGKGRNPIRLPAALDRLCEKVGRKVPPLLAWRSEAGRLHIEINGQWLRPPYGRVPLPLPRSAVAINLYLFLIAVKPTFTSRGTKISLRRLCDRLGLPEGNRAQSLRTIKNALAEVNETVANLDHGALLKFRKRIDMPAAYEMQVDRDRDCVRFKCITHNIEPDADDEDQRDDGFTAYERRRSYLYTL
jgi:hypothetical protein